MSLPSIDDAGVACIGSEWLQGRTAYGGASAAIALAVVARSFPGLPPLRSAQLAFIGPLAGSIRATPLLLRRGKNSAFVGCDVGGDDGIGLRALFLFMVDRPSVLTFAPPPLPADARRGAARPAPTGVPAFISQFDVRDSGPRADGFLRWARLHDRAGIDPAVELLAIADVLPPAAMALAAPIGPVSTTTWQINVLTDDPAPDDGWWLIEARTLAADNGTSSQAMTVWADGRAVATGIQSVALFY